MQLVDVGQLYHCAVLDTMNDITFCHVIASTPITYQQICSH